jgi:hypothetical protein
LKQKKDFVLLLESVEERFTAITSVRIRFCGAKNVTPHGQTERNLSMIETTNKKYDGMIQTAVTRYFPALSTDFGPLGWLWIKAQVWQESRFDPLARSPVGALGLMQLMPATAAELDVIDSTDPRQNLRGGVQYLADQYNHLKEIPDPVERMRFALASYNGGRGYINAALARSRQLEGLPENYSAWQRDGSKGGAWQRFSTVGPVLSTITCKGLRPDADQMTHYVEAIEKRFHFYIGGERG